MKHLEDQLQMAAVTWMRLQHPDVLVIHARNGGSLKSAREGAKFKRMGVVAGVADLLILRKGYAGKSDKLGICLYTYHGFFIELKAGKGVQSPAQKAFQSKVESEGYKYQVIRSIDEFIAAVNAYLD